MGIPLEQIPYKLWENIKRVVGGMAYVYAYHCVAMNGVRKYLYDQDEIPDGVYDLPDDDWLPEEGNVYVQEITAADEAVFIGDERR